MTPCVVWLSSVRCRPMADQVPPYHLVTYQCVLWRRGRASRWWWVIDSLSQLLLYSIDVDVRFYSCHVFYFLTFFLFCQRFLFFKKRSLKIPSKVGEALLNPQKQINRPRWYYESGWVQTAEQSSALGSAYSDTAAVTSCSRRSQYVKSWSATNWNVFSLSSCSYTAPIALGTALDKRWNNQG